MVKKIHYCWFGGEKPDAVKRNVEHWSRLNPDFEICEWNESNIDVSDYEFGRRALAAKKWGFLVDTIRPLRLVKDGGFYIDADVRLIRPLASLLENEGGSKLIMGYMYDCALGTAVLYAPRAHPYLVDILHSYNYIHPDKWPVSNSVFTAYFINQVNGFLLNGKKWENESCCLFPKEYFEQPAFIKSRGVSIHYCCGSWKNEFSRSFGFKQQYGCLAHFWKWAARKRRTWLSARNNEFTSCYKAAIKGRRLSFDLSGMYTIENPYK